MLQGAPSGSWWETSGRPPTVLDAAYEEKNPSMQGCRFAVTRGPARTHRCIMDDQPWCGDVILTARLRAQLGDRIALCYDYDDD